MSLQPAGVGAAKWLLHAKVDDWTLLRFGPPGYDRYLRIHVGVDDHTDAMEAVFDVLKEFTSSPEEAFAAIWEGWASGSPVPEAPRLDVAQRSMRVFMCRVTDLRYSPAIAWFGRADGILHEPDLAWPKDHAWFVACDLDDEEGFVVGCSRKAQRALIARLKAAAVDVHYGKT